MNCTENCPKYFSEKCVPTKAHQELIDEGINRVPGNLRDTWTWWMSRQELKPGKTVQHFLDDFRSNMDW